MTSCIVKRDIDVPDRDWYAQVLKRPPIAFTLDNVFTHQECEELIRHSEEMGYEDALVNVGGGRQQKMTDVRNSSRCIWDSQEKAAEIWERIKDYVPDSFRRRNVIGLNERLRILRYDPGGYFKPHCDGVYIRESGERSYVTIHIYLNEGYTGGRTTFVKRSNLADDRVSGPIEGDVAAETSTGSVLIFEHSLLHEGSQLFNGRKYTIRTDVMYGKEEAACLPS